MPVTLSKGTQSLVLAMGYENNSLSLAIPDASVLTITGLSPIFTLSEGEGIGSSTGTSTVTGIGSSLAEVVGSATGAATVAGAGASTKDTIGSSSGEASVTGIGSSVAAGVGSSTGTATVTGSSGVVISGVGSSTGTSTVSGVGADVATSFTPADLFAASESGIWLDPSDLTTMWTDDGLTQVTTDGDLVYRIDDKSGNNYDYKQATSAKRPTYRTSGGLHWLEFDGTDDYLFHAITNTGATTDFFAAFRVESGFAPYMGLVDGNNLSNGIRVNNLNSRWQTPNNTGNNDDYLRVGTGWAITTDRVATESFTIGSDHVLWCTPGTNTEPLNTIGSPSGARFFKGRFYGQVIRGTTCTAGEIADTEDWLAGKSGVTL